MATVAELRERLRRPLAAELAAGCQNRVVAGGVDKLLASPLGNPFPKIREVLGGYGELSVGEREEVLKTALAALSDGDEAKPTRVPRPAARQAVPLMRAAAIATVTHSRTPNPGQPVPFCVMLASNIPA